MRIVLAECEADMAARAAFEDQHRANDRLHRLAEQEPITRPVGIGAQSAEKWLIRQGHADAGFREITAPRVLGRIAKAASVAFQPIHQPGAVVSLIPAQRAFGLGDPRQGSLW